MADTSGLRLRYATRERLIACTHCGMAPMRRNLVVQKLLALAVGVGVVLARRRQAAA